MRIITIILIPSVVTVFASGIFADTISVQNSAGLVSALSTINDNDTIVLEGSGPYDLSSYSAQVLNQNITIRSGDNTPRVITGNDAVRLFENNGNVNFLGITFDHGYIQATENIVDGHTGVDINGGGVVLNPGTVTVFQDTTFSNNTLAKTNNFSVTATGASSGNVFGGAVYVDTGTLTFSGQTEFSGNQITVDNHGDVGMFFPPPTTTIGAIGGGALYTKDSTVIFEGDAAFSNNSIAITDDAGGVTQAPYLRGIAIYNDRSNVDFHGKTLFSGNNVTEALTPSPRYSVFSERGGTVFNDHGTMNFYQESRFENNSFDSFTVVSGAGLTTLGGTINFFDTSSFTNNNISTFTFGSGGAALYLGEGATVNFNEKSNFSDNSISSLLASEMFGGAIYLRASTLPTPQSVLNFNASVDFMNNSIQAANVGDIPLGGAIAANGIVNFNLTKPGETVTFQGNFIKPNGLDIPVRNAVHLFAFGELNFNHVMGTDIYFHDPITSGNNAGSITQTKCGTTHIIGGNGNFDFRGSTAINKGYFQLENGATFGNASFGNFTLGDSGVLCGDGTIATQNAIINGTIMPGYYLDKGYILPYEKGKTITLGDSANFGATSIYKPLLWADGSKSIVSAVTPTIDPDAKIFLNFRNGDYAGSSPQTYTNILPGFQNVIKAGFMDATYDNVAGEVTVNGIYPDFFQSQADTKNQQAVAGLFDHMVNASGISDARWDMLTDFSFLVEANDPRVSEFYDNVSGTQRANTLQMALTTPIDLAFNHIGKAVRYNGTRDNNTMYRANNEGRLSGYGISSQNLWFQPYYHSQRVASDGNCLGYDVDRTGFFVGTDVALSRHTYGGIFAGYSNPNLDAKNYKADANDYTLGALWGATSSTGWEFKAWSVFGAQRYHTKRMFDTSILTSDLVACPPLGHSGSENGFSLYRGAINGWTMNTGIEIAKVLRQRPGQFRWLAYRPFIAFDFAHAFQSGFDEDNQTQQFALRYGKENYDQTQFRMGASALVDTKFVDLNGRIMYTCLLGGDAAPSSSASFAGFSGFDYTVDGVNVGHHFLNLGLDSTISLNQKRSRLLTVTYEASLGNRSTNQTAALSYTQLY